MASDTTRYTRQIGSSTSSACNCLAADQVAILARSLSATTIPRPPLGLFEESGWVTKSKEMVLSESTMIRAPYKLGFWSSHRVLPHAKRPRAKSLRTYRTLRTLQLSNEISPTEPKTERFELRLSLELLARVDEWRRAQSDLPSRSEAVRRLMEIGLSAQTTGTSSKPLS